MLRKIILLSVLVFTLFTNQVFAQDTNAGFVSSDIWYSQDPFTEGQEIKIYTLIFNPEETNFKGTIAFFDDVTLIGKKDFSIEAKTAEDISVDWLVTPGTHKIFARIEEPRFKQSDGTYQEIYLENDETTRSVRTAKKKVEEQASENSEESSEEKEVGAIGQATEKAGEKFVQLVDKLPDPIEKPIDNSVLKLESFRESNLTKTQAKKETIRSQIDQLKESEQTESDENPEVVELQDDTDSTTKENTEQGALKKPLKYVELFFFTLFSFILANKIVFYLVLLALVIALIRIIWKWIF